MAYPGNANQKIAYSGPLYFPETHESFMLYEKIYLKANGRTLWLTNKAVQSYMGEYGFNLGNTGLWDAPTCYRHIIGELEDALESEPKPVGTRTTMIRIDSENLIFKLIGSKITNIRISLRYSSRIKNFSDTIAGSIEGDAQDSGNQYASAMISALQDLLEDDSW